jgi:uncharacterized membrane protein YfcA
MSFFFLALLAAGLAGGLLAGMLGIGGGIFFLLVLPDALKSLGVLPADLPATVVANSLLGTLVSALAAAATHFKTKTPGRSDIFRVGIPAAVTAYISLVYIVSAPGFNERIFSAVIVLVLALLLGRTLYTFLKTRGEKGAEIAPQIQATSGRKLGLTGALAGLVSSLTGLGGGVLIVPMLREWAGYPIRSASFVSSGAIVLSSITALYFSLTAHPVAPLEGAWGYIVPRVAVPLVAGVLVAAPFGVKLATRLSAQTLTVLYMVFVLLVLLRRSAGLFG